MKVAELLENVDATTVKLVAAINRICPRNFRRLAEGNAVPLYRGLQWSAGPSKAGIFEYAVMSKRTEPRQSKTDSNVFMSYVDSALEWKGYPKRALSVPTTPDFQIAMQHGSNDVYLVIPADNVNLFAYAPDDFNKMPIGGSSLLSLSVAVAELTSCISTLFSKIGRDKSGYPEQLVDLVSHPAAEYLDTSDRYFTLAEIAELSDLITKVMDILKGVSDKALNSEAYGFIDLEMDVFKDEIGEMSLFDFLKKHVNPSEMQVRIAHDYAEIPGSQMADESEVWFIGDHLLLKLRGRGGAEYVVDELNELLKDVNETI